MKFKKLVVLMIVLAALAAIGIFKKAGMEREEALQKARPSEEASLAEGLLAGSVTKIMIARGSGEEEMLVLSKDTSGRWTIENRFGTRAKKATVEGLLTSLGTLRGNVRAETKEVLADFSLTQDKAFHLRLLGVDEKEILHMLLSPLRPRGTQNFVRLDSSDRVIVTATDLLASLGIFTKEDKLSYRVFADLRVTEIDSSKIVSMTVSPEGVRPFTLLKTQEAKDQNVQWSVGQDATAQVDTAQVDQFVSSLSNLYANDTLDPQQHAGLFESKPPWLRIEQKAELEPEVLELKVGQGSQENKPRLVQVMPSGLVYELAEAQIKPLLGKNIESFLKKQT